MDIYLDLDECPNGHSATKVADDADCSVYFGFGNTYDDNRAIAIVNFKHFDISIRGGKSFREYLKEQSKGGWSKAAMSYLSTQRPDIVSSAYQRGLRDGKNQKIDELEAVFKRY